MKKRLTSLLLLACALLLAVAGASCSGKTPDAEPLGTRQESGTTATDKPETSTDRGDVPSQPNELSLFYDDRYRFQEEIAEIRNQDVTSRSALTGDADSAVLTVQPDRRSVLACGTGRAEVRLASGQVISVTVSPAAINLLFLFGQSNAEGMILSNDTAACTAARNQSVLCEEGQIYSTYAPYHAEHGSNIGGVRFSQALSVENAVNFVAASLTSDVNRNGEKLEYPLNNLSENGNGKSGMDSAIAYEWHRLTGEKVWIVNASHAGSSISTWQPGNTETDNDFWQALKVARTCQEVLAAEVAAGHYTFSQMGYFWLQGCADRTWSAKQYTEAYLTMHRAFAEQLGKDLNGDGTAEALAFGGIILVRHPVTSLTPLDLQLNGPRTSQICMGTGAEEQFAGIYLASTLGDLFVSDQNVEAHILQAYPNGELDFPTRSAYRLPSTVSEVHPDIHYRQPGYNELGFDAARNMLKLLQNEKGDDETYYLYRPDGFTTYRDQDVITVPAGGSLPVAVMSAPGAFNAKGFSAEIDCSGVTIANGVLSAAGTATGSAGTFKIYLDGVLLLTLQIQVT